MEQTNAMCKYRYVGHTSTDWTYIQQKFLVVVLWAFWGGIVKMVTWNCFCNELATSTCTTQIKCALYLSHNLLAPTAIQICHNICAVWIMCMLNCLYRKWFNLMNLWFMLFPGFTQKRRRRCTKKPGRWIRLRNKLKPSLWDPWQAATCPVSGWAVWIR